MKILADENLKDIEKYFSAYGDLQLLPGREINSTAVIDADVLLIRSVTRVDKSLLEKSSVKFVGTATSGTDHIDMEFLINKGIQFSHAHGSNARAVVDYCLSAIFSGSESYGALPKSVGVIGLGAVGSALSGQLIEMGWDVTGYDPLLGSTKRDQLARSGVNIASEIGSVFQQPIVSLHTPLTFAGQNATHRMVSLSLLEHLPEGGMIINASRGEVILQSDLISFLHARPDVFSVLDVWDCEPSISLELMKIASIATPHIAGYSGQAKALATRLLAESFCACFEKKACAEPVLGRKVKTVLRLHQADTEPVMAAVSTALPIAVWSDAFKQKMCNAEKSSTVFDSFRKSMINRAEYSDFSVQCPNLSVRERDLLIALGFEVDE